MYGAFSLCKGPFHHGPLSLCMGPFHHSTPQSNIRGAAPGHNHDLDLSYIVNTSLTRSDRIQQAFGTIPAEHLLCTRKPHPRFTSSQAVQTGRRRLRLIETNSQRSGDERGPLGIFDRRRHRSGLLLTGHGGEEGSGSLSGGR